MAASKAVKIIGGCLGAVLLLILISVAAVGIAIWVWRSGIEDNARSHAGVFLSHVQQQNYEAAFQTAEYSGGSNLYSTQQFQQCLTATVLTGMTSYSCSDVDSDFLFNDGTDVTCTVVSPTHGSQQITVHVNSPDRTPYLGFIWFSPGAFMGEAWHGDSCTRWSGREFFREPPAGRVRP